jgi:hypothetical protein
VVLSEIRVQVSRSSLVGSSKSRPGLNIRAAGLCARGSDDWDFKATLGDLSSTSARVNLAKDALAFCNLPASGTVIVGVTDDYERIGLKAAEKIDTTVIRRAIEKYIDGDFIVVAAEHTLVESGADEQKRYGIVHFQRRFAQPVLAALDGHVPNGKSPLFRSGDILIRRGAASIRANSGDVRRLFTNSIVHEERVRAVNELWNCLVEQRRLMGASSTCTRSSPNPNTRKSSPSLIAAPHSDSLRGGAACRPARPPPAPR